MSSTNVPCTNVLLELTSEWTSHNNKAKHLAVNVAGPEDKKSTAADINGRQDLINSSTKTLFELYDWKPLSLLILALHLANPYLT